MQPKAETTIALTETSRRIRRADPAHRSPALGGGSEQVLGAPAHRSGVGIVSESKVKH